MVTSLAINLLQISSAASWIYAEAWEKKASPAAQARTWGGLCATGREQSPVNVVTSKAPTAAAPLSLETSFSANLQYVKNTGHGVQLFETHPETHGFDEAGDVTSQSNGQPKGYSMVNGAKYNFYQVHWHTPSENTVDGVEFPLEAHFVHQLDDTDLVGGYHRLAVIGLLYELGECNAFLDYFWEAFPEKKGTAPYLGDAVDFNTKLSAALAEGYYHWYGSLTTPPCTEGVSWNLLKKRETVCQRQIDVLKAALGNTQNGVEFNNRVPQPLYNRVVSFVPNNAAARQPVALIPNAKWVYANSGETEANALAQAQTWSGLCSTGHEQSPIDIVTTAAGVATGSGKPTIETFFSAELAYVKNTGHGLQLFETHPDTHELSAAGEVVDNTDGEPKGYSMINGAKYNFYQVHWHTPSENTVDGKSFPMEAHFVHQLDDTALHGTYHRLAVIGLLYELGECNTFLDYFWNTFPETKGTAAYDGEELNFNAKLAEALVQGYYQWYGSLTTPPCTEGVSWNLLKQTQTVCQRQIDVLKAALAATQSGIAFNNRVPQPLNHRVVSFTAGNGKWLYANDGETEANAAVQEATWGGLCLSGREQSPIDVVTATAAPSNVIPSGSSTVPAISTHITAALEYVKNTGHGVQLFETSPATHDLNQDGEAHVMAEGQPKGHSMINGAKYNFYQVHWHTPSENTVDGKSFPLEAHFVHQLDDPALVGGYHRLAVIGLLYELGECNTFLDYFWDTFPKEKGTAAYEGEALNFNAKLAQALSEGYYHWYGSLTTPPCTEGVNWNLLKRTQTVCQRQVDVLKAALGATQHGLEFNNRVPQPLYNRVVTVSGGVALPSAVHWVYAEEAETEANALTQARTWGGLCVTGHEQSPIDVVTADAVATNVIPSGSSTVDAISTNFGAVLEYVKNTGHGLQLFETSPATHDLNAGGEAHVMAAGQPKGHSMINGAKYNFYQVHWHTPSENTVDGQSFPLEAHFVHQLDDTDLVGGYHRLAVIGLLYELGECNTFLDNFWDTAPTKKGTAEYTGSALDFNAKLSAELAEGYYHWFGSLTTPPCTEGVSWNLLKRTQTVCQRQVDKLKTMLAATQHGIDFNNRVTMPLNHRVVTSSEARRSRPGPRFRPTRPGSTRTTGRRRRTRPCRPLPGAASAPRVASRARSTSIHLQLQTVALLARPGRTRLRRTSPRPWNSSRTRATAGSSLRRSRTRMTSMVLAKR
jgi:carbonic anhydrase